MKKIMMIMAVAVAALVMISCERYDDGRPQKDVRNEFNRMYPEAFDVEWEWNGTHWDVSFETGSRQNGTEHEARYDKAGNWLMTKTEMLITAVPQQIKDFLSASPDYGTAPYADNDAEFIETPTGNFYRFDLRVNGVVVEVDVNANGEVTFAKYDF
jgi:hypothetical protein